MSRFGGQNPLRFSSLASQLVVKQENKSIDVHFIEKTLDAFFCNLKEGNMKSAVKWGLLCGTVFVTAPAMSLAQETVFTDPNCCVLLDTKLSDEMTVAPGPFPSGYFVQFGGEVPGFVGEYQGTYGDNWRPKQSTYRGPRSGGVHGGIDIYAPSVPGPVRAPIVAPVGGEATVKPDDGVEKLGNRVWISFEFQGEDYRMMLGHLSEFAISSGPVDAGQIIGYAGCTGNPPADCSNANACGLTSGHVHIQLLNDTTGKRHDPAKALRWNLRYFDDPNADPCSSR